MLFVTSSVASFTCLLPLPDVLALDEMGAEGEDDNLAGWYAGAGVARLVPLLYVPPEAHSRAESAAQRLQNSMTSATAIQHR